MHAKLPTSATNLSKLSAPPQAIAAQPITTKKRYAFFCHLMYGLYLPLFVNSPFSVMRIAGKICSGVDSRIASEYRNWTYNWKESVSGQPKE